MKKTLVRIFTGAVIFLILAGSVHAEDMRAREIEAREKKAALLEKAKLEKESALKEAQESKQRILADKEAMISAIAEFKKKRKLLEEQNNKLKARMTALTTRQKELLAQVHEVEGAVRELVGFVRMNAKDLDALLRQSLQSAFVENRGKALKPIMNQVEFPGMNDIRAMVDLLFDEITRSGEVKTAEGPFVNRSGEEISGKILTLGNFSAAYRISEETGFLLYSDTSRRLFALSKLPPHRMVKKINAYMNGKSEDVPIDISKGAALRQLTHRLSLVEQIPKGGPIVWPIMAIAALAFLIVLERVRFLLRTNIDIERFVDTLHGFATRGEWDKCAALCEQKRKKSIPKVLLAGINNRNMRREDLENVLQEAILNEIPKLERFLSTLGMLAAIAPLLGLLGTVTGMINTFHVITYYGTGDPRMMSGGISEALVTTMLGLSVAIPIMLSHTLLSRKVENIIAQMEEKAVTFVNTLFKLEEEK
ncbi:MAG: hypothetical protein B6I30_04985 [Desulfobacteraceae bacterium 4572_187]|nr:MAG: hypothetical protein B6I30_04985 [Desulfobacteraceae bacterium 4572_187]